MHVERTFTVPRPIEAVFDYLGDFTHTVDWDPGTVDTTVIQGDGGLGTTYDNVSQFLGRGVQLEYETTIFQRPSKLQFRGTNGQNWATDTLTLRPVDGGTEIHYRADFVFSTLLAIAAPFFIKPKLGPLADETVEQLARTLQDAIPAS